MFTDHGTIAVETYRGRAIYRTAHRTLVVPRSGDAFCVENLRESDEGPTLHTEATVEACREFIDEEWNERTLDALKGLLGLVEIIAGRNDLPSEIRVALETNHRTIEAIDVIEAVSPTSLADTFARTWSNRMRIGAAEGFRREGLTASEVAGAVNLLDEVRARGL
jgi:hypothetical protein